MDENIGIADPNKGGFHPQLNSLDIDHGAEVGLPAIETLEIVSANFEVVELAEHHKKQIANH